MNLGEMKTVIRLTAYLLMVILIGCTGNTGKGSREGNSENYEPEKNPYPQIKTKEEFNSILNELGITLADGLEFKEFKSEIPQGSQDKFPSVFRCVYKINGENFKTNEDSLLRHYIRTYNEKLKSSGWTNSSYPGTGILDFHKFGGKIKTVSIRVTTADEANKTGKQELTIEMWAR